MFDWNVVVTTHERRYRHARTFLVPLGVIRESGFYNVLVMQVEEPLSFLDVVERALAAQPEYAPALARVLPVTVTFCFQSPQEFEDKAATAALAMLANAQGNRFHVRMHRRGFKGRLSSQDEEHFLDDRLLEALRESGTEGIIDFSNPDWILALDTVGQRAGLSLWSRTQLLRHPLLKLD